MNSGVVLFDGLGNVAQLKGAKLSSKATEEELHRARETVAFNVASQFLALISRQEQLRVQRQNLQAVSQLEQQIQTFVDNGARTIADLYQQQANAASARFAVVDAERQFELAKVDLMQTLQLEPTGVYEFEAPEDSTAAAAAQQLDLGALQVRASDQRIDLKAQQARVDAADQNVRVARSNRWPTLYAECAATAPPTTAPRRSDFSTQLDDRRGGSISLGVSGADLRSHGDEQRDASRRDPGGQRAAQSREPAAGCRAAGPARGARFPGCAGTARRGAGAGARGGAGSSGFAGALHRWRFDAGRSDAVAGHAGAGRELARYRALQPAVSAHPDGLLHRRSRPGEARSVSGAGRARERSRFTRKLLDAVPIARFRAHPRA